MAFLAGSGFVVIAVLVFGALLTLVVGVYLFLNPSRTATDRLSEMQKADLKLTFDKEGQVDRITERLSRLANPTNEDEKNVLRTQIMQAGYTSRHAPEVFNAARAVAAIALPVLIVPVLAGGLKMMPMFGMVVVLAMIGYYTPSFVLDSQVAARQKLLMKPFPDALDLLVSSVEAGLGLDAAFRRVAEEMEGAAPELAYEFQMVNHEISAGIPRMEALRHLTTRTGVDEIGRLVNMLTQAERFGTSIARSLRIHSSITRQKRMSRAEEEAAKVSPKLTIVMILFLLPCLILVLLGPAAINVKNTFFAQDGG